MATASFSPQEHGQQWRNLPRKRLNPPTRSKTTIIALLLLLHLTTLARAAVTFTNDEYAMMPDKPFTITWEGNRAPVTLTLVNGPDEDLQPVMVIASGLSGTRYTWTPPATLKMDRYNLQIEDGVSTDYSPEFQFPAPALASTTASPTPSSTSTSTPSSSPSNPPSSSSSLSTPAVIGIAIGASVAGILLLTLLGCFIYKRGKKAGAQDPDSSGTPMGAFGGGGGDNFDEETMVGTGSGVGGPKSVGSRAGTSITWGGSGGGGRATPFAELGQQEYSPRELWAGSIARGPGEAEGGLGQGQGGGYPGYGYEKGGSVQERSYQVTTTTPPAPVPAVLQGWDEQLQIQQQQQQQQRGMDDWHVSPASRSGTGLTGSGSGGGFVGSPSTATSSPPMGYSATVTVGGPPSTPPLGMGAGVDGLGYGRGGSPFSFSSRKYAAQGVDEGHDVYGVGRRGGY